MNIWQIIQLGNSCFEPKPRCILGRQAPAVEPDICNQGCIICSILPSGMGARGVSLEHVENMEMFSCSPTGALWFSEKRAPVLGELCSGSRRTVLWFSENHALVLGEPCSGSRRTVLWFSVLQLRYAPVLQIFGLRVWSRKYLYLYAGSQGRILWESAASQ